MTLTTIYSGECPCRHCEDRHMRCHIDCDKYLSWKDTGYKPPRDEVLVMIVIRQREIRHKAQRRKQR